jgi:hypothetical protein
MRPLFACTKWAPRRLIICAPAINRGVLVFANRAQPRARNSTRRINKQSRRRSAFRPDGNNFFKCSAPRPARILKTKNTLWVAAAKPELAKRRAAASYFIPDCDLTFLGALAKRPQNGQGDSAPDQESCQRGIRLEFLFWPHTFLGRVFPRKSKRRRLFPHLMWERFISIYFRVNYFRHWWSCRVWWNPPQFREFKSRWPLVRKLNDKAIIRSIVNIENIDQWFGCYIRDAAL